MFSPLHLIKGLADDTRLKALLLIQAHHELCVCELQQALQLSQPKISRHLADLRSSGLVVDERRGKWVYYRLNPELPRWLPQLLSDVKQAHPEYWAQITPLSSGTGCTTAANSQAN